MGASIFLYSAAPFCAAYATSLTTFIIFRSATFIGVCVEFVAAVTWLAEVFQDKKQKEKWLGITQAFASIGGVCVTVMSIWINGKLKAGGLPSFSLPTGLDGTVGSWRYLLMTGILPAIPIALLLPFVPESQVWREKKASGALKRPSFGGLFSPELRKVTLVTTILSACAYGIAFGALQVTVARVTPGLPELTPQAKTMAPMIAEAKTLNTQLNALPAGDPARKDIVAKIKENAIAQAPHKKAVDEMSSKVQFRQEMGGLAGRILLACLLATMISHVRWTFRSIFRFGLVAWLVFLGIYILARPSASNDFSFVTFLFAGLTLVLVEALVFVWAALVWIITKMVPNTARGLLKVFQVPALIILPVTYFMLFEKGGEAFLWGYFLCGLVTVAQFSYFGEYLPKIFPLHLRGTGGSFATNVGGRMIGTCMATVNTSWLAPLLAGGIQNVRPLHVAMAAGYIATSMAVIALIVGFLLPEPKGEE
jgi:hypothetical protein